MELFSLLAFCNIHKCQDCNEHLCSRILPNSQHSSSGQFKQQQNSDLGVLYPSWRRPTGRRSTNHPPHDPYEWRSPSHSLARCVSHHGRDARAAGVGRCGVDYHVCLFRIYIYIYLLMFIYISPTRFVFLPLDTTAPFYTPLETWQENIYCTFLGVHFA